MYQRHHNASREVCIKLTLEQLLVCRVKVVNIQRWSCSCCCCATSNHRQALAHLRSHDFEFFPSYELWVQFVVEANGRSRTVCIRFHRKRAQQKLAYTETGTRSRAPAQSHRLRCLTCLIVAATSSSSLLDRVWSVVLRITAPSAAPEQIIIVLNVAIDWTVLDQMLHRNLCIRWGNQFKCLRPCYLARWCCCRPSSTDRRADIVVERIQWDRLCLWTDNRSLVCMLQTKNISLFSSNN